MNAEELHATLLLQDDIEDHVDDAVRQDNQEKDKGDNRLRAILGEDECLVQNCQLKLSYAKQEEQIKFLRVKLKDLTSENERYRKAIEKKATPQDREDCLITAMRDKMVQVLKEENRKLEKESATLASLAKRQEETAREAVRQKEEFVGLLGSDKKLYEQYQQLKLLDERTLKVQALAEAEEARLRKAKVEIEDADLKFMKLLQQLDEAAKELTHKKELVKRADMILRDGFRIMPPKKPWTMRRLFSKHEPKA